jgi:DNA-binding XRE family transcriptional regulator
MALVIGRDVRLVEGVVVKRRDGHGRTPELVCTLDVRRSCFGLITVKRAIMHHLTFRFESLVAPRPACPIESEFAAGAKALRSEIRHTANTFWMKIREVFARNLRRRRHARGLSQEALAHEADMDRTYISALERGLYGASIDTVAKLAEVLGIEPDELLQRLPKPPRSKSSNAAHG